MPMVAAFKFHQFAPAGKSACQPDTGHGGLGPGVDHAHLLDARHPLADQPGHLDLQWVRDAERKSVLRGAGDGVDDHAGRMAKDRGPPGANIINQLAPIGVPEMSALRFLDKKWLPADSSKSAHRRVDSSWDEAAGFGKKCGGAGRVHPWN